MTGLSLTYNCPGRVIRAHLADVAFVLSVYSLNVVHAANRLEDTGQMGRDDWIAVIGEVRLVTDRIVVDLYTKSLFDRLRSTFYVDDEPVCKSLGDRQTIGLGPVDDSLLIFSRGSKARIPLLRREVLVEVRRVPVLQICEELFFLSHLRRSESESDTQLGFCLVATCKFCLTGNYGLRSS